MKQNLLRFIFLLIVLSLNVLSKILNAMNCIDSGYRKLAAIEYILVSLNIIAIIVVCSAQ